MSWLETKYIGLLSGRLLRFKRKSPVLFNFRCPLCGDSEVSKTKARGYIYQRSGSYWFSCHNCTVTLSFQRFLKQVDGSLYNLYLADYVAEKKPQKDDYEPPPVHTDPSALSALRPLHTLPPKHPARQFLRNRKIPIAFDKELYFAPEFKAWTNSLIPNKFDLDYEEERIVIPFSDSSGMFGYQGRSLEPEAKVRYIQIMLDESKPKVYGLHRVDLNRKFYMIEGPFDSMFLKNALASGGGKITSELLRLNCDIDNATVVYDNEPRNKDVVANVRKAVYANYSVVLWPSNLDYKDINEMVMAGYDEVKIEKLLREHTFKGLRAQQQFSSWAKV